MAVLPIELASLSNGSIQDIDEERLWKGTGVFDKLIDTVSSNINIQLHENRITQPEYGTVYLGALQQTLSSSIDFLLQQAIVQKDIELKSAQILALGKDNALKDAQLLEVNASVALKNAQKASLEAEDLIKAAQSAADIALKTAQTAKVNYEVSNVLPASVASTNKQVELFTRQIVGFDDNKNQKMFDSQINSWGLMYSSGILEKSPGVVNDDAIASLYNKMMVDPALPLPIVTPSV